ncbi:MAG: hypothetical protein KatS3mg016_1175 [Fimbriimonadales bacterium]|nr:MAG: hypothetical protein KatS3mg016_1175 [Fimbriimonadales bacterium]
MQSSLRERLAHVRRRTGFSARENEIEPLIPLGIEGAVDKLLENPYDHTIDDEAVLRLLQGDMRNLDPRAVSAWWLYRMLVSQQPIQERLALFWHNHFATSASKVQAGRLMLIQIQLFQRLGLDNFKTLTLEVAKDPAMLVWLDGNRNVKGKPNENFARELFELFTMGIGHYTERDIREAARAFTGWSFSRVSASFVFNRSQHDDGEKEVFGKRGRFTGEQIIEMAVEHPATAQHIARKFYQHFINDVEPPDTRTVEELAKVFRESDYSIRALMRRLLLTPAFWSPMNWRKRVKSPVEFVVGALRQVGVGERLRAINLSDGAGQRLLAAYLRLATQWTRRIGQALLYPPDVSGWEWGKAWISSTTMLERMRFAEFLLPNRQGLGVAALNELIGLPAPRTLEEFLQRLETALDVPLQPRTRQSLLEYLEKRGGVNALRQRDRQTVQGALQIVFSSAEYQML